MKDTKVAIFDFDGTLADIVTIVREIYVSEAAKRGWPELTDDAYTRLRKGTIRQAMKWIGIRPWQVPGIMRSGRRHFYASSKNITLFPGAAELLKDLKKDGFKLYILSSNSPITVKAVLERNGIDFMHIMKRQTMFGKAKTINKLVRINGYDRNNVWMIGDEVRDIEAAHGARVRSIGVVWGLQDESILKLTKPDHLAHQISDIERILKSA